MNKTIFQVFPKRLMQGTEKRSIEALFFGDFPNYQESIECRTYNHCILHKGLRKRFFVFTIATKEVNEISRILTFFLPVVILMITSIPILPFLTRKTGSRVLGFCFFFPLILPQIIDDITRVRATSFLTGDPRSSMLTIISCTAPCILLEILVQKSSLPRRGFFSSSFLGKFFAFSFLLLSFLTVIGAITSSKPFVPTFGALSFLYLIFLIIRSRIDLQPWLEGVLSFGLILSSISFFLGLFKFPWMLNRGNLDVQYQLYLQRTYISIFNKFLGFAPREGLFFNDGAQCSSIFFGTLFLLMLVTERHRWKYLGLAFVFIDGSLSGSRTFYLMVGAGIGLKLLRVLLGGRNSLFHPLMRIGVTVAFYFIAQELASKLIANRANLQTFSGRTEIWNLVLHKWSENGFFGHGMNSLRPYVAKLHWSFSFEHAHNSIMQWLWDYGILGFLLSLICYLCAIFFYIPTEKNEENFNAYYSIICLPFLGAITEVTLNLSATITFGMGWLAILLFMQNPPKFAE